MELDINQIAVDMLNAVNQKIRNLKHLNIAVVGKTGVGKSTLINSVFRENLAETGIGRPVTTEIRKISKPGYPLSIYDTPGFELGQDKQKQIRTELLSEIKKGIRSGNVDEAVHCIWYCVNAASSRIEPEEVRWLKEFSEENRITQVPVVVVLTQSCFRKRAAALKTEIEKYNLDIIGIVPVLAQDVNFDEDYTCKAYGLETMGDCLPEELQDTLQNVQIVSLKAKKKRAHAIVAGSVTAAFGEGFVPIPLADSAMLIPTQVAMIASVTAVFGMNISKSILTGFVSSVLGAGGATVVGKTIAGNLLKLVPGAGTAVGGTISAVTAGLITTALGEAYISLMSKLYTGEISKERLDNVTGEELAAFLREEMQKEKEKEESMAG